MLPDRLADRRRLRVEHPGRPAVGKPVNVPLAYAAWRWLFAMVVGMPDEYVDLSGNTQAFRAFAQSPETPTAEPASKLPLIVAAAAATVVVVTLLAWFVLS